MSAIQDLLVSEPAGSKETPSRPNTAQGPETPGGAATTTPTQCQPVPEKQDEIMAEADAHSPNDAAAASAPGSAKRNPGGGVSSVYSGNKMKHLKKEDGKPLWRRDIQYDFLRLIFFDQTRCFTKFSEKTSGYTFAEVYIDAMAKSSKCSKILKEKLLQDQEGAICMAMVCLLVNVGRMNTTLNFFPEMRAQLRTYHSIPALQAQQDPNAYKQLQDAPRLKSILKGATEDEPQPSTVEGLKKAPRPRANAVTLVFILSQYAPKITELHFNPPRDFFDLIMRSSLSSTSRARAFLWLMWWYLESDFTHEDSQRNPFGPGGFSDGEEGTDVIPTKVPNLESLTEEQAAAENVDTPEEERFGETKRKERIAILASEPSPAMVALKRARKEKERGAGALVSDDEASEVGLSRSHLTGRTPAFNHETASDYTRSPSPSTRGTVHPVNIKPAGDIRINHLLNSDDMGSDTSSPRPRPTSAAPPAKKGPGRGNWRRNRVKQETVPLAARPQEDRAHPVPLLPNTGANVANEAHQSLQSAASNPNHQQIASGSASSPPNGTSLPSQQPHARDHVPTPSYQAQKRFRGVTQHQSNLLSHRRKQIEYTLGKRIRRIHIRAYEAREAEGSILRAWKRMKSMPAEYDSEEEANKSRKGKDRTEKDKENVDGNDEGDAWRRSGALMAGYVRVPRETSDIGEEAAALAKALRKCTRRLQRWQVNSAPGNALIKREKMREEGTLYPPRPRLQEKDLSEERDVLEPVQERPKRGRQKRTGGKAKGKAKKESEKEKVKIEPREPDEDDGGGELDEEDRELLGEVDADESEEDEDVEMADGD